MFMDIEKNPGPPLHIINHDNDASYQDRNATITGHRFSQDGQFQQHTHTTISHLNVFIYSRADLFKIRFESSDMRPGIELLSQLKRTSLQELVIRFIMFLD